LVKPAAAFLNHFMNQRANFLNQMFLSGHDQKTKKTRDFQARQAAQHERAKVIFRPQEESPPGQKFVSAMTPARRAEVR
jgi:hypothetical protein